MPECEEKGPWLPHASGVLHSSLTVVPHVSQEVFGAFSSGWSALEDPAQNLKKRCVCVCVGGGEEEETQR